MMKVKAANNMINFWKKLKKPIIALAPMAGITDAAFRYLCGKFGADIVYSEMVSATALAYGNEKTLELAKSHKRNGGAKFVVQLFGNNPDHFAKAVKIIEKKIKPDGIDVNFGCPVQKIQRAGAGVALFRDLEQSRRVLDAVLRNAKSPVSVKVRISAGTPSLTHPGLSATPLKRGISVLDFIEKMKNLPIAAIMIHGRTLAQGFSGPIDYKTINRVKKKFKGMVIANGGIKDAATAKEILKKTHADGIGIAQAACGNPWIFQKSSIFNYQSSIKETFKVAWEHAKLMEKLKGKQGILEMRKHLCWYVKGMPGAAELRQKFVKVKSLNDIKKILK